MGLDFLREKGKAFVKQWDGGREMLAAPDLLEGDAEWQEQHVLFDLHDHCSVAVGEELIVQTIGNDLVALRGHDIVATATMPPPNVRDAVRGAHGYVLAQVARVSVISRTIDLEFQVR